NWPGTTGAPWNDSTGPLLVLGMLSSLRMVPTAEPSPITAPSLGLLSVTVKSSSFSGSELPSTQTVMVLVVWPAAKLTVPKGSWSNRVKSGKNPPTMLDSSEKRPANGARLGNGRKSEPSTSEPLTSQSTLTALSVSNERVTVKVNAVAPKSPSILSALV